MIRTLLYLLILDDFVSLLISKAEIISPIESVQIIDADPSDNKFLEAAIEGKVQYLVSGDKHLLELHSYKTIPIISANEFIALL